MAGSDFPPETFWGCIESGLFLGEHCMGSGLSHFVALVHFRVSLRRVRGHGLHLWREILLVVHVFAIE